MLIGTILLTEWPLAGTEIIPADARTIALTLYQDYLFAFEALGVLLLAAVIGGLYLARRDDDMPQTNDPLAASADEEGA
jgi:NADH:ubiquinone oxidoreductase subunit 6 (subunit J)